MKTLIVILAVAAAGCVGCSSTHQVQRETAVEWLPEASTQLTGTSVTAADRTGQKCKGKVMSLDQNQIQLWNGGRDTSVCLSLDSVSSINSGSNIGVVILGVFVGMAAGGQIGRMIGEGNGSEQASPSGMFPHGLVGPRMGVYAAVGAIIGGVLGGVMLGVATETHDYVIIDANPAHQKPGPRQ